MAVYTYVIPAGTRNVDTSTFPGVGDGIQLASNEYVTTLIMHSMPKLKVKNVSGSDKSNTEYLEIQFKAHITSPQSAFVSINNIIPIYISCGEGEFDADEVKTIYDVQGSHQTRDGDTYLEGMHFHLYLYVNGSITGNTPRPANYYEIEDAITFTVVTDTLNATEEDHAGYYNGSSYLPSTPMYYNGSNWIECEWKYYDGTNWLDADST